MPGAELVLDTQDRPVVPDRNPTTSVLTATTLIYAIGAGITAAAGTRLALQLILVTRFKFCLLYTCDAADQRSSLDLGGLRLTLIKHI